MKPLVVLLFVLACAAIWATIWSVAHLDHAPQVSWPADIPTPMMAPGRQPIWTPPAAL